MHAVHAVPACRAHRLLAWVLRVRVWACVHARAERCARNVRALQVNEDMDMDAAVTEGVLKSIQSAATSVTLFGRRQPEPGQEQRGLLQRRRKKDGQSA